MEATPRAAAEARPAALRDLLTPCLLVDRRRLAANARRMRERARRCGVGLRPHVKTTKCAEIARIAHGDASGPITVSTLKEAEYFFDRGFADITYAVSISPNKFARAAALADRGADLKVLVSTVSGAMQLAGFAASRAQPLKVMLEVDSGEHRTGFLPDAAGLPEAASALLGCPGLLLDGLLTHGGHSYGERTAEGFARVAEDERLSLLAARDVVAGCGASGLALSSGSTPTAVFGGDFAGIDEIRPGVYLAGDLFQAQLGTVSMDDIAISVLASVIAHDAARNALAIDAGGLALSKDRSTAAAPQDLGYGVVVRADGTPFAQMPLVGNVHQEHGEVTCAAGLPYDEMPVGSLVRVLPNHVCMTAAPYDRYFVLDGDEPSIVDEWEKVSGW